MGASKSKEDAPPVEAGAEPDKAPSSVSSEVDEDPPDNGAFYCSLCNWIGTMYDRFDKAFVTFFILQNINHGLWIIAVLAVKDYYKEYLGLDPGEMAIYISIIHIPWSFKIVYGLISDNVPLFGTRRKSYLIIMGIIQFLTLFSLYAFEFDDPLVVAILLAFASMSEAFTNVVSDAIMVIQSRKDKKFGSQDFITLLYLSTGTGGALGCIIAGIMTEYFHPKWSFYLYSFNGVVISFAACFLTRKSEKDAHTREVTSSEQSTELEDYEIEQRRLMVREGVDPREARNTPVPKRKGFCFDLKQNCRQIGKAVCMREIYQLVIFFILLATINPAFSEFSYFFLLDVIGISKFMFSMLVLIGQLCHIVGALIYKAFCRNVDTRTMVLCSFITTIISNFLNFCFAKRWNLGWGIPDIVFLLFTDNVFAIIGTLLYTLPIMALFAKITPKKIEGTTYAFLTGTMNLGSTVISPGIGTFINSQWVGVKKKDLSNYSTLVLISLICSIVSLALLPLIPSKKNVKEWVTKREAADVIIRKTRKERRAAKRKEDEAAGLIDPVDDEVPPAAPADYE